MALPPQAEKITKQLMSRCEKVIDQAIRDSDDPTEVSIACSLLPNGYHWIAPEITKKYREVGWKRAEFISDQRVGDFLQLEA